MSKRDALSGFDPEFHFLCGESQDMIHTRTQESRESKYLVITSDVVQQVLEVHNTTIQLHAVCEYVPNVSALKLCAFKMAGGVWGMAYL